MKRSGMFRERNEWPSTAGEAEERSGYMELCDVAALSQMFQVTDSLGHTTRDKKKCWKQRSCLEREEILNC